MMIGLDRLDAALYRQWARFMLGLEPSASAMGAADRLFERHGDAIQRVARALSTALLPVAWTTPTRTLYRGLRLEDPTLAGRELPRHPAYARLPAFSFTEDPNVACYFADPGALGMPVLPLPNFVTGKVGLPDHGYIGVATVSRDDVLFHWRYAAAVPDLVVAPHDDVDSVLGQQEVTIRNHSGLSLQLEAFETFGAEYVATRYPGGRWIPSTAVEVRALSIRPL
jgi:hypothetical protein